MSKLGAEAFAFVNFARFAVPLRIGLALSTTPWIKENVVDRFGIGDGQDNNKNDDKDDKTTTEAKKITKETTDTTTAVAEEEKDATTISIAEETVEDPVEEMKDLEEEIVVVTAVADKEPDQSENSHAAADQSVERAAQRSDIFAAQLGEREQDGSRHHAAEADEPVVKVPAGLRRVR